MCCSAANQCSGVLTLEASCIFLVAMAACTQSTRLRFQISVLLYVDKAKEMQFLGLIYMADNFTVEVDECLPEGVRSV